MIDVRERVRSVLVQHGANSQHSSQRDVSTLGDIEDEIDFIVGTRTLLPGRSEALVEIFGCGGVGDTDAYRHHGVILLQSV